MSVPNTTFQCIREIRNHVRYQIAAYHSPWMHWKQSRVAILLHNSRVAEAKDIPVKDKRNSHRSAPNREHCKGLIFDIRLHR